MHHGVKVLEVQLGIGCPIENMPDEFWEWIIVSGGGSGYMARYRVDPDAVVATRKRWGTDGLEFRQTLAP